MNRSRLPIVLFLIFSIVAAGFTRRWAASERSSGKGAVQTVGGAKLSQLNSFALTLLLGGLRGPLVMFLWPSAETQKQEKNLEDFDTKIELIRLLQAEFDTVHIFQIWNKAYNISVQMANVGNKYRTILSALDYAHQTDAERPNDINLMAAIGQVYFDKLGNSAEKVYYRQRVRDESLPRQEIIRVRFPSAQTAAVTQAAIDAGVPARRISVELVPNAQGVSAVLLPKPAADALRAKFGENEFVYTARSTSLNNRGGGGRGELDAMLDDQFKLLPDLLRPKLAKPADWPTEKEFNDGGELQYLKRFEPYPYGISPWALGYNYWKRAQVLQNSYGQKHAQLSDLVIDSRPGLSLKFWGEEEMERGRQAEIDAFAKAAPTGDASLENIVADVPLDTKPARPSSLNEAVFEYARGADLSVAALAEYDRHLRNDPTNLSTYLSHIDELHGENELMLADHDYLIALSEPARRGEMAASAAKHYRAAQRQYELIILQYTISEELAAKVFPMTRASLSKADLSLEQVDALLTAVRKILPANLAQYENGEDFTQYMTYITRARTRLKLLPAAVALAAQSR